LFVHLDSELARCQRSKIPLAVLVCDLDGFKQVNDRLGHLEGNRVLRAFARKLKEDCREYDYVARMGGDEFVLALPGLTPEIVPQRLHRLHRLATEAGREVCGTDLLSLSAGHSFYLEDGTDAEQLLAEADRRMFAAKRLRHNDSYTPITEPVRRAPRVSSRRPRDRRGRATSGPNRELNPTTAVPVHQAYPSTFVPFRRRPPNCN
jgi:diguanylate cyclase (GGDEF)-like protein